MSDAKAVIAEVLDKRGVPGSPRTYRADASAILSALAAAGLAVVPMEPTDAMLRAAATLDWNAQTDPTWREIYAAMLAASGDAT